MKNSNSILSTVKNIFAFVLVILLPIFFLPFTQEYYVTNKLYLLAFAGLAFFLLSAVELLITKKIVWQKRIFDNAFFLFVIMVGLSVLLISPNKIQALLDPNFGLVAIASLFVFYYYLSRTSHVTRKINLITTLNITGLLIALVTFVCQQFQSIDFPSNWLFLKNSSFTPLGIQIDLAIFLGFFAVFSLNQILIKKSDNKKVLLFNSVFLLLNSVALTVTLFSIFKPFDFAQGKPISTILPPLKLSWFAAVEVLKNPLNALFGIGVNNFSSMFARIKDLAYNQSSLWQIQSFTVSRSAVLHILTETGIFGLLAFSLLIFSLFKQVLSQHKSLLLTAIYLLLVMLFFPPSFITFFLLAIFLSYVANSASDLPASPAGGPASPAGRQSPTSSFDVSGMVPIYLGLSIVAFVIIGASGYFLTQGYRAEIFYKKALDGYNNNNLKDLYDNQRQAILINPYIEKYRISFSQTNLLIANNVINRAVESSKAKSPTAKVEINSQDQQTISQAIQAAISEAKAAVALNPQKAVNWENLGVIYRNIMSVVQGQADTWTVSAYQQAISLDPQNPSYRLNLGSVYYGLGVYDEAVKIFEQVTALKSDWPNAYYNLAWALFQKADYQKAALSMQNTIYLLDQKKDKADYDKATKDLEEFKKKIPNSDLTPTPTPQQQVQQQLTLPTPQQKVEPPINLPKEASPEAR